MNPLLLDFNTAPFSKITHKDFKPAIKEAIDISREEIEKITSNSAPPDFQNTTEALDFSGQKLGRITSILSFLLLAFPAVGQNKSSRLFLSPAVSASSDEKCGVIIANNLK